MGSVLLAVHACHVSTYQVTLEGTPRFVTFEVVDGAASPLPGVELSREVLDRVVPVVEAFHRARSLEPVPA